MLLWLKGKLLTGLTLAAIILGALFAAFRKGRSEEREDYQRKQLEDYAKTRKDIDNAVEDVPDDRDAILSRMRERADRWK